MNEPTFIANKDTDAARRALCGRAGRGCRWNWSEPALGGTPGQVTLTQDAWCQTCGRERHSTMTVKTDAKDLAPLTHRG